MEIMKVQNLCKIYGKGEAKVEALKQVSFSLRKGEFAAVVGESGSGKSTLLNCIGALDEPTSGSISIDGQNLFAMEEEQRTIFRRRNIGFIFQSFHLVPELSVEQNIIFPLFLDHRKPDFAQVDEILGMLGLMNRRKHLPGQLSGGQQQRAAIGRALITKPKLILADEPTGNLDSQNSQDVMELLIQASRRYQQTILMITHNPNLAALADRVMRVSDGFLTDLGGSVLLQSKNNYILTLYLVAAILAVLVAFSGMLMILGSLNSNVAQRTEFFGMMRCLGATGKQVRRFVRIEALSWCKTAIPLGLALSMATVWVLCSVLKGISPTYFGAMPDFGISLPGIGAGFFIGLLTVLAATGAPAKKASKVSPLTAVSGNADTVSSADRAADTRLFSVETALGIHHAVGSRKNLFLLAASFAFSMILFLGFGTGIDFMQHALTPLRPYTPDVSVVSPDNGCTIPASLLAELKENPDVRRIFGRSFAYDLPVKLQGQDKTVILISYEANQFRWAERDLKQGNMESAQKGDGVLLVLKPGFSAKVGDEIEIETKSGPKRTEVAGILDDVPFNGGREAGILICSEALFQKLTGETGYTILDIQLKDLSDSTAEVIRSLAGDRYIFSDQRADNSEVRAVYYSFSLFVYGFLAVVALIASFNIINSMGMSASARMHQYGAMRAIGTSVRQLNIMVAAETWTYLFFGLLAGLALGLPLHRFLYQMVITERWGDVWRMPVSECCVIASVMLVSGSIAIAGPVRQISRMSIVETISTQ